MFSDIKQIAIDGTPYQAERVTDGNGLGYIELSDPDNKPLGRITYHGSHLPMDVTTYDNTLPRPLVEWLLEKADEALAF